MVTIKSKIVLIVLCIVDVIWLLLAQNLGNKILLLPCLACFLALIVWTALQGMVLPVLLLFLPFSTLLKISAGTISFYTVALLLVFLIYAVKGIKNISIKHMVPGLGLLAMVLVVKTLYGESMDNSFLLFFLLLLLAPFIKRELGEKYDLFYVTMCFAVGIAVAAITSRFLMGETIRQYVKIHEYSGLVRYSGYYGDPNFYSAHITAALGGVLILLLGERKKLKIFLLIFTATVLVYCGALSVSKSFFLVTISMTLIWVLAFMFQKNKITTKITIVLIMLVGAIALLASTVFSEQIGMLLGRFTQDNNISDFTTKRVLWWESYITASISDWKLFLFGRGLSNVLVNDRASHNTIIQCMYQFGILGCTLLIMWAIYFIRTLLEGTRIKKKHFVHIVIILVGGLVPWLGVDILQFDEFFLIPMYICIGFMYLAQQDEEMLPYESADTVEQK